MTNDDLAAVPFRDDHENDTGVSDAGPPLQPPLSNPLNTALTGGFCQFCGKAVPTDAVICLSCGRQIRLLQTASAVVAPSKPAKNWDAADMTGLVLLSLILPCIGFIFGVVGVCQPGKQTQGIILLCVSVTVIFLLMICRAYQTAPQLLGI